MRCGICGRCPIQTEPDEQSGFLKMIRPERSESRRVTDYENTAAFDGTVAISANRFWGGAELGYKYVASNAFTTLVEVSLPALT